MGTTTKALKLLDQFTVAQPELGLSEMARRANVEKATTYRLLNELCATGFVEQNPRSKLYRLGPAVIRYATLRERTFPAKRAAVQHLEHLAHHLRETCHVTQLQGLLLSPVHCYDSPHQITRVHVDPSELLPLHATSSGKVVLAFGDDSLLDRVLADPKIAPLSDTLKAHVRDARRTGFGRSDGDYETDVSSIAAPLFGGDDLCLGAVSVVCPSARMTPELQSKARAALKATSRAISQIWGGDIPAPLHDIWKRKDHG